MKDFGCYCTFPHIFVSFRVFVSLNDSFSGNFRKFLDRFQSFRKVLCTFRISIFGSFRLFSDKFENFGLISCTFRLI